MVSISRKASLDLSFDFIIRLLHNTQSSKSKSFCSSGSGKSIILPLLKNGRAKLNGRAGASFHIEHASGSQTDQNFFHLGRYSTVFQAEVFAIAEVAKKLIMDRIVNEKIIILVDSQAAILAIQNNIVKSNTVLTCIKNLNILGKDNDVTIAWTPGHTGIQGNEKADILAKSGSALNCSGPEPFISIPYASCRAAIKDWSVKRN